MNNKRHGILVLCCWAPAMAADIKCDVELADGSRVILQAGLADASQANIRQHFNQISTRFQPEGV